MTTKNKPIIIKVRKPRNPLALEARTKKAGPMKDRRDEILCSTCEDKGFLVNKVGTKHACPDCQED